MRESGTSNMKWKILYNALITASILCILSVILPIFFDDTMSNTIRRVVRIIGNLSTVVIFGIITYRIIAKRRNT
jgi:hypothetical protein